MAQKVNPIGIRLTVNRHSDSNWFSNYYYSALNAQDYVIRHYLKNLKQPKGAELGIRVARAIIHHYPKKTQIHLFYLGEKSNLFKKNFYEKPSNIKKECNPIDLAVTQARQLVKLFPLRNLIKKQSLFTTQLYQNLAVKHGREMKDLFECQGCVNSDLPALSRSVRANSTLRYCQEFWRLQTICNNVARMLKNPQNNKPNIYIPDPLFFLSKKEMDIDSDSIQTLLIRHNQLFMDQPFLWNHLQKALSGKTVNLLEKKSKVMGDQLDNTAMFETKLFNTRCDDSSNLSLGANRRFDLTPIKIQSLFQSAPLLAQEICINLEKRAVSFRQIWRSVLFEANKLNYIKGIRVVCSGRLNGAEIAKIECRKYAATSLHVFSNEIDYGFEEAKTLYGILGVKVWIAYKQK